MCIFLSISFCTIVLITFVECFPIHKCNPRTRHALASFIAENWKLAQNELGIANFQHEDAEKALAVSQIYQYCPNALTWLPKSKPSINYAVIFKCANEAIGRNLDVYANKTKTVKNQVKHYGGDILNIYQALTSKLENTSSDVFTFIRDPLSRFYSGFDESMYRTLQHFKRFQPDLPPDNVTTSLLAYHLDTLFKGAIPVVAHATMRPPPNMPPGPMIFELYHIYPQTNSFFEYPITIVGHLENFTSDWKQVVTAFSITAPFDDRAGFHATAIHHPRYSANSARATFPKLPPVRALLKQLFQESPQYLRAVCHYLFVDYACFPEYPLPAGCEHLSAARAEAVRRLDQAYLGAFGQAPSTA